MKGSPRKKKPLPNNSRTATPTPSFGLGSVSPPPASTSQQASKPTELKPKVAVAKKATGGDGESLLGVSNFTIVLGDSILDKLESLHILSIVFLTPLCSILFLFSEFHQS